MRVRERECACACVCVCVSECVCVCERECVCACVTTQYPFETVTGHRCSNACRCTDPVRVRVCVRAPPLLDDLCVTVLNSDPVLSHTHLTLCPGSSVMIFAC